MEAKLTHLTIQIIIGEKIKDRHPKIHVLTYGDVDIYILA